MIVKPRCFIYRRNRNNDSTDLINTDNLISVTINSDTNRSSIIVRTSNPNMFKIQREIKFADGKTYFIPQNSNEKFTFDFLMYLNYNGGNNENFFDLYYKQLKQVLPSNYLNIRNDICKNYNITTEDNNLKTTRLFTDQVLYSSYIDGEGIYNFEFIPLFNYIIDKSPMIPNDDEDTLKAYSKASGESVDTIKSEILRKFGYKYNNFNSTIEQGELSFNDIQKHIHLMLSYYLSDYGIKILNQVSDFDSVSSFGKITYGGNATLGNLIQKLRKSFGLRISQGNSKDYTIEYYDILKKQEKVFIYDLFTDISADDVTDSDNIFFCDGSVNLATGMKLNINSVVELKKFGDNKNYDVYLKATFINNTDINVDYNTKYYLFQYRNGVKSNLNLTNSNYNIKRNLQPTSTITAPIPSPFNWETTISNATVLSGINTTISNFLDAIKCQGSACYKLNMEFSTPLFNSSVGDVIFVSRIFPYNMDGIIRYNGDIRLYEVAIDRIVETIDSSGYVFDISCVNGAKIQDISFISMGSFS